MEQPPVIGFLPCPESWDGMQPAEGGKHCASCDKFIPDMVDLGPEEIAARYEAAGGKLCGRVQVKHTRPVRLHAGVWVKPALSGTLRQFVLAFVAAFGLSVWGLSTAEAAPVLTPETALSLAQPDSLFRLEGEVVDSVTGEPVVNAYVVMQVNGKNLDMAQTDSLGRFLLVVPAKKLRGGTFDLTVSWMGKQVRTTGIPADVRAARIELQTEILIPEVEIVSGASYVRAGVTIVGIMRQEPTRYMIASSSAQHDKYYHKLEDYIQMRSSEVHMQGRW